MSVSEGLVEERRSVVVFFEQLPRISGAAAVVIGVMMLAGWWLQIPGVSGSGAIPSMTPLTAATFVVAGVSLFLSHTGYQSRLLRVLSPVLALLVIAVCLITAAELLMGLNFGLDRLLAPGAVLRSSRDPARMAINTAIAFLFVGLGLVLLPRDRRTNGLRCQIAAFEVLIVALIALVGYAFGVRDFYSMQPFLGMALISAITFVILGLGLLFSELHRGLPGLVADGGAAGLVARRLLPGTV